MNELFSKLRFDFVFKAIVLSTGVSKFKVRFIDFGDTTDVDSNTIRQIAKKHCSTAPYAYRCTFKNAQGIFKKRKHQILILFIIFFS